MCMNFKQGALGQRITTDKETLTSLRGHIEATGVISILRGLEEQWAVLILRLFQRAVLFVTAQMLIWPLSKFNESIPHNIPPG